jgi:cytochrome o ubiquinol oxidase operon protein cyoD
MSTSADTIDSSATSQHATMRGYLTGFVLAVILTAVPFWLIGAKVLPRGTATAAALGFAAVQIVVHMHYFLHLSRKAEGGWSLLAFGFTALFVVIVLWGSAWVMEHMNENMMPMAMPAHAVAAHPAPAVAGMPGMH